MAYTVGSVERIKVASVVSPPTLAKNARMGTHTVARQNPHLTFPDNPLPYGCGSIGYNVYGFVGSDPAGDDRTALPWAGIRAWIDGTLCTLAADDFKTYCLPGAGADCGQDEAWARECLHAEARDDKDSKRLGLLLPPILGREFRQAGCGGESDEKRG